MRLILRTLCFFSLSFILIGCEGNQSIVNRVDEREANEIVVFLASKGIEAQKVEAIAEGAAAAAGGATNMYDIVVSYDNTTEAMSLLNRNGLPRRQGTNLLELFAKSGLMSSEREETIRYQAGLAEQLRNTIRKIDGVIDADVQISFPSSDETVPGQEKEKPTAAVYIKHQGMLEDPNNHIETKIKRLMAGSVNNLTFENVSVISDRARLADISLTRNGELIGPKALQQTHVSIWSIVMTKSSLARFRFLFFSLILLLLLMSGALGWMVYKFYPQLLKKKTDTEPPTV